MMDTDWRYSDQRMKTREQALGILLKRFGGATNEDGTPTTSPELLYTCAHDWVSQGNVRTDGLVAFFKAYYL